MEVALENNCHLPPTPHRHLLLFYSCGRRRSPARPAELLLETASAAAVENPDFSLRARLMTRNQWMVGLEEPVVSNTIQGKDQD